MPNSPSGVTLTRPTHTHWNRHEKSIFNKQWIIKIMIGSSSSCVGSRESTKSGIEKWIIDKVKCTDRFKYKPDEDVWMSTKVSRSRVIERDVPSRMREVTQWRETYNANEQVFCQSERQSKKPTTPNLTCTWKNLKLHCRPTQLQLSFLSLQNTPAVEWKNLE